MNASLSIVASSFLQHDDGSSISIQGRLRILSVFRQRPEGHSIPLARAQPNTSLQPPAAPPVWVSSGALVLCQHLPHYILCVSVDPNVFALRRVHCERGIRGRRRTRCLV